MPDNIQRSDTRVCRFRDRSGIIRVGLVAGGSELVDLTSAGLPDLATLLESPDPFASLQSLAKNTSRKCDLDGAELLAPVERQEIWAAGVTYLRSKQARMEESDFSATAYDRVYDAERPELFFKAHPEKVVGPGSPVGIRRDATWNVPEPELALVLNSRGSIVGYTICNDMSSRDIEGANLLYLPQAKIYDRSCAVGPWLRLHASEEEARSWTIQLRVTRGGNQILEGAVAVGRIKRRFTELAEFLFRSQKFPHGAILSTGTGIVPPEKFTLEAGDRIAIDISGIGTLENAVVRV